MTRHNVLAFPVMLIPAYGGARIGFRLGVERPAGYGITVKDYVMRVGILIMDDGFAGFFSYDIISLL